MGLLANNHRWPLNSKDLILTKIPKLSLTWFMMRRDQWITYQHLSSQKFRVITKSPLEKDFKTDSSRKRSLVTLLAHWALKTVVAQKDLSNSFLGWWMLQSRRILLPEACRGSLARALKRSRRRRSSKSWMTSKYSCRICNRFTTGIRRCWDRSKFSKDKTPLLPRGSQHPELAQNPNHRVSQGHPSGFLPRWRSSEAKSYPCRKKLFSSNRKNSRRLCCNPRWRICRSSRSWSKKETCNLKSLTLNSSASQATTNRMQVAKVRKLTSSIKTTSQDSKLYRDSPYRR